MNQAKKLKDDLIALTKEIVTAMRLEPASAAVSALKALSGTTAPELEEINKIFNRILPNSPNYEPYANILQELFKKAINGEFDAECRADINRRLKAAYQTMINEIKSAPDKPPAANAAPPTAVQSKTEAGRSAFDGAKQSMSFDKNTFLFTARHYEKDSAEMKYKWFAKDVIATFARNLYKMGAQTIQDWNIDILEGCLRIKNQHVLAVNLEWVPEGAGQIEKIALSLGKDYDLKPLQLEGGYQGHYLPSGDTPSPATADWKPVYIWMVKTDAYEDLTRSNKLKLWFPTLIEGAEHFEEDDE